MLTRLFATNFAARMAERTARSPAGTLESALLTTGVALASSRRRRTAGLALLAAGGVLAWRRGRAAKP